MVRNQGPIMPDDESTPVSRDDERGNGGSFRRSTKRSSAGVDDDLDNRFAGLDEDEGNEQQFRRAPRRVPVRRGAVTKKVAARLKIAIIALIVMGVLGTIAAYLYSYGMHSWRFRIDSSDNIQIAGNKHVSRSQILQVMGGDIGRNIYFVPLDERRKSLEQIPWVQSASVMRLLPNHLRVNIQERTPVAFIQFGQRVELIDAEGVVMEIPVGTRASWAFPVVVGMRDSDPLSMRAARMKIYEKLITDLDSTGEKNSLDLNEVDLSDPEDVKVTVADNERSIMIHLGNSDFLDRFKLFKTHVKEWQQQHANLQSVDLRYEHQVILNEDSQGSAPPKSVTVPKPGPKTVKAAKRSAARKKR
jgi:cell division protein FtsQ